MLSLYYMDLFIFFIPRLGTKCSIEEPRSLMMANIIPPCFIIGYLLHFIHFLYLHSFAFWYKFGIDRVYINQAIKGQVLTLRQQIIESG